MIFWGFGAVVELLLRHEADPAHLNAAGRNALHFAARHDCPGAIQAVSKYVELPVRVSGATHVRVCLPN